MVIKKFNHIAIMVRNTSESINFYQDMLGLEYVHGLVFKNSNNQRVFHSFLALEDRSCLALFEIEGNDTYYNQNKILDQHFALECSKEYVDIIFKKIVNINKKRKTNLIKFGFQDHGFVNSFYFNDPSGNWLELTYFCDPWFFSKKNALDELKKWEQSKK
ncbi:hypothetical protein CPAV1605_1169 [seawater metagenome]|uniref:VOC domain-containing protein n=1 Tax=seawater metagenome TaxID=1561972 RepID=A0A5E8CJA7_9ZZZZ